MSGIIFDLDGVLVDSMPAHYKAWEIAFREVANIKVDERTIYLLEGMRGSDLVKTIFEQKGFNNHLLLEKVNSKKNEIFKTIASVDSYDDTKEIVASLECSKAVVSGSAKEDVEAIIDKSFGKTLFEIIITADDIEKGKPDPSSFIIALRRMNLKPSQTIVVENAPLGVQAANNAGIKCIVVLNNSPLMISDFKSLTSQDEIFKETRSAKNVLQSWCRKVRQ
ncbi:MAG TPA: HAD family phosphatase [Nitrososphaeraceae archaeon]|nr:HAD family phosphatase [Nitrososphaeraceae archaeon]